MVYVAARREFGRGPSEKQNFLNDGKGKGYENELIELENFSKRLTQKRKPLILYLRL